MYGLKPVPFKNINLFRCSLGFWQHGTYLEFVLFQVPKARPGAHGIVLTHPGDKNKDIARVGHPNSVAIHKGWIKNCKLFAASCKLY